MTPDTSVALVLSGPTRQRALTRKALLVGVSCRAEACTAKVGGTVRGLRLKTVKHAVAAGRTATIKVPLSKPQRRKIRAALKAGHAVRAHLHVTVADAAGNTKSRNRTIRIRR